VESGREVAETVVDFFVFKFHQKLMPRLLKEAYRLCLHWKSVEEKSS